eukprot:SAG11_NODE_7062_length_1200_cov_1.995459_1_plen_138_part_10
MPYYADPAQPGCSGGTDDGVECADAAVERCSSAIDLTITTVDTHVHVRRRFELPVLPLLQHLGVVAPGAAGGGGGGADGGAGLSAVASEEAEAELAAMFRTDRQAGLAFPTAITPFDCTVPEHADREICVASRGQAGG